MSVLHISTLILFVVCATEELDVNDFSKMKNQLADFFHINIYIDDAISNKYKFEFRRQKIKKAFYKFMDEGFGYSFGKDVKSKLRTNDLPEDEKNMTATQLFAFHGYEAETHTVQTRDGYVLKVHRILSVSPRSVRGKELLVLLHHGLMGSSEDWVLLGPGRALPYLLSDAGYDVWLTNARGNKYTRFNHGNVDQSILWDFSFHEMGYYDLAAVIDYIQSANKNDLEINFVGHSMGSTALLVLLSTLPQYNQVLNSATLLAPLAFMFQIKGPLKLLAEFYKANGRDSLNFLGENEFMLKQNFPYQFTEKYCISTSKLCNNPLLFLTNGGKIVMDTDLLENLLSRIPEGTSIKTIIHYLQLINSGKFQKFDYGASGNIKRHGILSAPSYDLSKVTLYINLFISCDDWLYTKSNMQILLHSLPNVNYHTVEKSGFSHTDFVWGQDASALVFHPVLELLANFDNSGAKNNTLPTC